MRALLAWMLVLTVASSGCLGLWDKRPDYVETESEVETAFLRFDNGQNAQSSVNTRLIGYHNGVDDSGDPGAIPTGGYYTELAYKEDRVYLVRGSQPGADRGLFGGFSIIDIQDPDRPTMVGSYAAPTGSDIEVNDDETLAFFGTQRNSIEETGAVLQETESSQSAPRGIHVVDISDKTNPTQAAFYPIYPNGAHTITYWPHKDGNEYLIVCTYDLDSNTVPADDAPAVPIPADPTDTTPDVNPATQRVIILQIQEDPTGADGPLTPVAEYSVQDQPPENRLYFPHDTYVEEHPVAKDTLLYVAYWDQGVHILDFDDPSDPTLLDSFNRFEPSTRINTHFARPLDILPGGHHITVTEPEIISADETGYIFFLDTTDPENIQKPGPDAYWTLPGDHIVQGLDWSPHNFDVRNGVVALAHNQAGVWFIDVSDLENLLDPKTTGYYIPDNVRSEGFRTTPYTWGTRWIDDTTVLVSDEGTGLHIIEYIPPSYP